IFKHLMVFRKAFILFLLTVVAFVANAQEKVLIKGLVFEKGGSSRVEAVNIQVKNHQNSAKTDEWGNFAIEVNIGDTLLFSKLNYEDTEKPVLTKTNLVVYLTKAIALKEVVVKEQSKSKQQQEIL